MSSYTTPAPAGKKPFMMRIGKNYVSDLIDGQLALGNMAIGAKTVYYVDGNYGNDGHTGTGGWHNAFKTLTVALAASNADIASGSEGWAARNVIFAKGDTFTEDLVLLAQKTDVIGVGNYGQWSRPGLVGNHVPTGETASYGTRFYNFHFQGADTAPNDIWTLDTLCNSLRFENCVFDSQSTTAATAAIVATALLNLHVINCEAWGAFSDAVIELNGDSSGTRIIGNYIEGANQGIHLNSDVVDGSSGTQMAILISENTIYAATECIMDEAGVALVVDNRCISQQASGLNGVGVIDAEENLALNNFIAASDRTNMPWPAVQAVT